MNKRLVSILCDVFSLREKDILLDLNKDDVDNWDSLKQMDLVMSLEREFDITLEIEDIIKLVSVREIIETLKSKGVSFED